MEEEVQRTLEEPNGQRVTGAILYKALYDMDGRILDEFCTLNRRLDGVDQRCGGLDSRLTDHTANHPPWKTSIVRISGISGIIAAVVTAAGAIIGAIIHRGW